MSFKKSSTLSLLVLSGLGYQNITYVQAESLVLDGENVYAYADTNMIDGGYSDYAMVDNSAVAYEENNVPEVYELTLEQQLQVSTSPSSNASNREITQTYTEETQDNASQEMVYIDGVLQPLHNLHQSQDAQNTQYAQEFAVEPAPEVISDVVFEQPFYEVTVYEEPVYEETYIEPPSYSSIWTLINSNSTWALETDRRAVKKQIRKLQSQPEHIIKIRDNTELFIGYVSQELLKRNMPIELALLPMVESNYNPHAYSSARAAGIWQFIPRTADIFDLQRDSWVDERRDVVEATDAALNYLNELYQKFDFDWLLALAAYNGGEGTVRNAINENRSQGKSADFWSLDLPLETQNYAPKLLALNAVVQQPDYYNYQLPDITAFPDLTIAPLDNSISLDVLADTLSIDRDEIKMLNAHFLKDSTPLGSHNLILPTHKLTSIHTLNPEVLAVLHLDDSVYQTSQQSHAQGSGIRYTVEQGDSLWNIATTHGVTVEQITDWNRISTSALLQPGQSLIVGYQGEKNKQQVYHVKSGDSLWSLSMKFNCSIAELKRWNNLTDNDLDRNQRLIVMTQ